MKKKADRNKLRVAFYDAIDAGGLTPRDAVKKFRKMLGLTQREFAKMFEISPRILMDFEQGKGNPTLATIEKMLIASGLELRVVRRSQESSD